MASTSALAEADCGLPNPLTELSRHLTEDLSRREEYLGHGAAGGDVERLSEPIPLHPADVFSEDFLTSEERSRLAPETFRMNDLLREMLEIDSEEHRDTMRSGPIRGPSVADIVARGSTRWADELLENEHLVHNAATSAYPPSNFDSLLLDEVTWMGGPSSIPFPNHPPTTSAAIQPHAASAADAAVLAWEHEAANQEMIPTANQLSGTLERPRFSDAEFVKFFKNFSGSGGGETPSGSGIDDSGRVSFDEENTQRVQFSSSSSSLSSSAAAGRQRESIADKWATELELESRGEDESTRPSDVLKTTTTTTATEDRFDAASASDFMEKLQQEWEAAGAGGGQDWLRTYDHAAHRRDASTSYVFDANNPYLHHEGDLLEEGRRRLRRGDLANAILYFEAVVQKDPTNAEAWQLLGTSQAENEQELASIAALRKCVEMSPDNLTAWMALAVSYTNESLYKQGCDALRKWLEANEKYRHIKGASRGGSDHASPAEALVSPIYSSVEQREIQARFIQAVRETTSRDEFDFELQLGLGVLFNISGEYDKAVDCFQAALKARPEEATLWNRLGATLANGNRSEESVQAYQQALRLSPGFVRCRYNLGIACINLSAYRQAVEHLLTALKLQSAGIGPVTAGGRTASMSENIWTTLRLAVSLMGRTDLLPHVNAKSMDALEKELGTGDDEALGASF